MKTIFNLETLIRPTINALKPYSSARDEFDSNDGEAILLDANESPFDNGLNRYPDPHQRVLKQKLSELKNIPTDHIVLGNGSDEVLDLLFRAFCEPNLSSIVTLTPTYGMYDVLASINAIENIEVPLSVDFNPEVAPILKAIKPSTKLLFICSPNNPTGNTFPDESIEKLLNQFNGLVVIDEAYIDFSDKTSWLERLEQFPNLVITQTMSKAWGLAGIRLGFCFASPKVISVLKKIKPPYNVNELTQQRALKQLNNFEEVSIDINTVKKNKAKLINELNSFSMVEMIAPSDTNFLLVRFVEPNKVYKLLRSNGIIVRNRSTLKGCENCLRITVGTSEENKKLLNILKTMVV